MIIGGPILIEEVEKRKNLNFNEIEKLSQDIKSNYNELIHGEYGLSRYGMNHVFKKYAGLDDDFKIHALFEHGIIYTEDTNGAVRVHEYLPSIVASQYRINVLKKDKSFKGAYAIGPYIHYGNPLLSTDQINQEKERLGRNLLVFPSHSIEGLISEYNIENFCKKIDEISKDYDSVRICMYYKEVALKKHIPYQKHGFEVVTAGHFNDYNFIPRLKSIILTSDMTMSNEIGSHLGYCIYLNKPHYLFQGEDIDYKCEDDGRNSKLMLENEKISEEERNKSDNVFKMKKVFGEFNEQITKDQYELIKYLWGFDHVKTPSELKKIFLELNENYSTIQYYLCSLKRVMPFLKSKYVK